MRHAMARFDIAVSSVYWRLENASAHQQPDFQETEIQAACSACVQNHRG
jgi:hypothetical protein